MNKLQNAPLAPFTSFKVGGPAKTLIEQEDGDNLSELVAQIPKDDEFWVLGFGTNSLISDKGLDGSVILNRKGKITPLSSTRYKADSGVSWDDHIKLLIKNDLWGLEFTSGIPGGVGAAVAGNIAAYGHKVADCLVEITLLDTKDHRVMTCPATDLEFAYRQSKLQKPENAHLVILDATFELKEESSGDLQYSSALAVASDIDTLPDTLTNRRKIILEARKRAGSLLPHNATGPWTAGSFFKNPLVSEKQAQKVIEHEETSVTHEQLYRQNQIHGGSKTRVSAAHVLLAAGFKRGQSWGNVRLHPEHILKIENSGHATAQEIYSVVQEILVTVREKLDITLVPEVRFLGDFS